MLKTIRQGEVLFKLLEDTVRYDQMNKYSKLLEATVNQIIPGYIGQPIQLYKSDDGRYLITGRCSLNDYRKMCMTEVPVKDTGVCYGCEVYKNFIDRTRTG